jgi:hypothetical protein
VRQLLTTVSICLVAAAASAQQVQQADIDEQLQGQLDFRSVTFKDCFNEESCTVDGVTIAAYRQDAITDEWLPTALYWDPIDGIGVKSGAQNDEIDVDERIVLSFDGSRNIECVWLSDLFISEHGRYGAASSQGPDAETANIEFSSDGEVVYQMQVSGQISLPWNSFNETVHGHIEENSRRRDLSPFVEGGDMQRRVTLTDDEILLLVPRAGSRWGSQTIRVPLGEIDQEKKDIFAGVETVEIDLTLLLAALDGAPLFAAGSSNADRIEAILDEPELLSELGANAGIRRVIGSRDNGEVAGILAEPVTANTVTFLTPLNTSNDFSVAGLILTH